MVVLDARLTALCALLLVVPRDAQANSILSYTVPSSEVFPSSLSASSAPTSAPPSFTTSSAMSGGAPASVSTFSGTISIAPVLSPSNSAISMSGSASSPVIVTSLASNGSISSSVTATDPAPESNTMILIPSYSFTRFPVPSASAIPGVFPATSPQSPPPPGSSVIPDFGPAWANAHTRARQLISGWSLEQKVATATGVGLLGGRCVGNTPAVADYPGLCLEDSPLGVRDTDFVTAFPAGITVASTWKRSLMRARGLAIGQEFKGKGVNVALGPMMNMGRVAQAGRNWEGFGADPFLAGEAAYETVLGLQQAGVQACAKHFINNEQEHFRTSESSNVDDRTEHEIYLHPFLRSVQAGVASVMCSYNLINGTYACGNDQTLNILLKDELGFQGYVMSDWGAQHSTLDAVAGLDMSMPGDVTFFSHTSWFGANLTAYVENGTIAESRVDDMAERIIAAWYLLGQDENYPAVNFNAWFMDDPATNEHVNVQDDHYKVVREIGAAGTVLLKNVDGALPLKKLRSIAVIGNDSSPSVRGPNGYRDRVGVDGTVAMGWGSGTAQFPYLISPVEAIQARARAESSGSQVSWFFSNWDLPGAAAAAVDQDAALVFVNADSGEDVMMAVDGNAGDRNNLTLWINADPLIAAVAAQNPNTIVIVHSVGPAIVEAWIENPNVTAVLWANLPGQESGNSIADVLWGDVNPSGRLPYTIAKRPEDYGVRLITEGSSDEIVQINYTEGLNIDYRHFDANGIEPRFELGFGLSYTTFSYSDLQIKPVSHPDTTFAAMEAAWAAGKPSPAAAGGSTAIWLHRPAFSVSFTVKNTGQVAGTEIPQLYVHFPSSAREPPSVLKGFTDVDVPPGSSQTVEMTMSRYDLSVWDTGAQGWKKPQGDIAFSIGASSRDLKLKGTVPL
ncbi:beta-glucosidase [Trametes cingulata]|nr:beta-glucosidase [Trametes cingulata]